MIAAKIFGFYDFFAIILMETKCNNKILLLNIKKDQKIMIIIRLLNIYLKNCQWHSKINSSCDQKLPPTILNFLQYNAIILVKITYFTSYDPFILHFPYR